MYQGLMDLNARRVLLIIIITCSLILFLDPMNWDGNLARYRATEEIFSLFAINDSYFLITVVVPQGSVSSAYYFLILVLDMLAKHFREMVSQCIFSFPANNIFLIRT